MADSIRVNIGGKAPTYLPASGEKKQVLYVDVAENRRRFDRDQQKWIDLDPHWYEAKFQGADADLVRDQLEQGDALILIGTIEHHVFEKADGTKFNSTKFYVDSFGIDPRLTTFTIDRSKRQARTQQQTQQQAADRTVSAAADATAREAAGVEIVNRLSQLVEGRFLSPDVADRVMISYTSGSENPSELAQELENTLVLDQAPVEARLYVVSVAEQYAGTGTALEWSQAVATAEQLQQAHLAQQAEQVLSPWPQVQQIKHELHGTAASGPGM